MFNRSNCDRKPQFSGKGPNGKSACNAVIPQFSGYPWQSLYAGT